MINSNRKKAKEHVVLKFPLLAVTHSTASLLSLILLILANFLMYSYTHRKTSKDLIYLFLSWLWPMGLKWRCVYPKWVGVVQPLNASFSWVFLEVLQLCLFQQKSWTKYTHGDTSGIADAAQQPSPKISGGRMPVSLSSIFFGRWVSPQHVLGFCVSLASCSTECSFLHCSQLSLKLLHSKYFCGPSRSARSDCKTSRNLERKFFLWMDWKEVACCQLAQGLSSKTLYFLQSMKYFLGGGIS